MYKRIRVCLIAVAACLVLAALWAVLAVPGTALADHKNQHKAGGFKTDQTFYSVKMWGDLTIEGALLFVDGVCLVDPLDPPCDWGRSGNTSILVNSPLPAVCIAKVFLQSANVTLEGAACADGVMPCGDGPNWGTLSVSMDNGVISVAYKIGEGTRRYKLSTIDPVTLSQSQTTDTWPIGDGTGNTEYTVVIPTGTGWSLVQSKKRGVKDGLETTLFSQVDTTIIFTECVQ